MKKLTLAAAAAAFWVTASASAWADSIALRFLGTGEIMPFAAAMTEAGVDLARDTNLSAEEIALLEARVAGCWAVPMIAAASEIPLGTGYDCLVPLSDAVDSGGAGISLRAMSFFVFESGIIITLGKTSVRPFRDGGIGDADGAFTHMTGSIPSDKSGVIGGTGAFVEMEGAARVSGAVNLNAFPGEITFDCLWIVQVKPITPRGRGRGNS